MPPVGYPDDTRGICFQTRLTYMSDKFDQLTARLGTVRDLETAQAVLAWDQETYMPEGGAEARAHQLSTLSRLSHERLTDDRVGELLESLRSMQEARPYDSFEASLVRVTRRKYEKAVRLPSDLVAELSETTSRAKQAWKKARAEDTFSEFEPHLERIVELTIEKAEALGYEDERYDALLDEYEPEMKTARVRQTFSTLRDELVPIVDRISDASSPDADILHQSFDEDRQWDMGIGVLEDIGYDFDRGRQDRSTHPFTTTFSVDDVRITTRFNPQDLSTGLFGSLHEGGHALYEQGIDPSFDRTPLAEGASLGIHESQSRLWENMVGRSRSFWQHYLPQLADSFPEQLAGVALDTFYRAINTVSPSLIRVESDEVTYNLHIMVRFEIEQALINEDISAADVPGMWRALMDEYLDIRPDGYAEGSLQDIHWSLGAFGYFPTYALGNLMAGQLYEAITADIPDLHDRIAAGEFGELLAWLRENVHRHGKKFTAEELLERATESGLTADPWVAYIREKYSGIYNLNL